MCCRNGSVKPCECSISRSNVLQKPSGREAPLPKRCKYHRNARFCLQTVARSIENKRFQFFFVFGCLKDIFLIPHPNIGINMLRHPIKTAKQVTCQKLPKYILSWACETRQSVQTCSKVCLFSLWNPGAPNLPGAPSSATPSDKW